MNGDTIVRREEKRREEKRREEKRREEKSRVEWMDIFRGWGIILMIMGHVEFGSRFDHFIHAFHMPMFFFVSGYFFSSRNMSTRDYVKKKAKALLIPYVVFGALGYGVWLCYHAKSITPLYHLLFINTEGLPIAGAIWFLTALFLAEVIYFIIDKYVKNVVEKNWLIVSIAVFGTIATSVLPVRMPYALDAAFVGVGLFHIGYMMRSKQKEENKYIDSLFNLNPIVWFVLAIFVGVFIFKNGYINMRTGTYGMLPWFWSNAVFAILIGINFSKFCEKTGKIMKPIMKIGRNSITYVCLNQVVLYFLKKGFAAINNEETFTVMELLIEHILILICAILILYILDWIFNNVKVLRIFIGK